MSEYKPIEKLNYTIYKWIHTSKELNDLCYVGSTANLSSRKRQHKLTCNNPNDKNHNILLYKTIREHGGFTNFKMVILATAEQITKREAQALEEEYRIAEKATLNSNRCYTTDEQKKELKKQYEQYHKEEIAETKKKYRQANKEAVATRHRNYEQEHKEEIAKRKKEYYQENKEEQKQYYQANKEAITERKKQYYQANKAKILEQVKQYRQAKKLETQTEEEVI
jgi:hypothetical protein